MSAPDWSAPVASGPVDATVALPGSKSLTNRYLVLAALAAGPSRLRRPLRSRDTLLMADALSALGVQIADGHHGRAAGHRGPASAPHGHDGVTTSTTGSAPTGW